MSKTTHQNIQSFRIMSIYNVDVKNPTFEQRASLETNVPLYRDINLIIKGYESLEDITNNDIFYKSESHSEINNLFPTLLKSVGQYMDKIGSKLDSEELIKSFSELKQFHTDKVTLDTVLLSFEKDLKPDLQGKEIYLEKAKQFENFYGVAHNTKEGNEYHLTVIDNIMHIINQDLLDIVKASSNSQSNAKWDDMEIYDDPENDEKRTPVYRDVDQLGESGSDPAISVIENISDEDPSKHTDAANDITPSNTPLSKFKPVKKIGDQQNTVKKSDEIDIISDVNEFKKSQAAKILDCYNTEEAF